MDDHTLSRLGWLALEVKYLEPAKDFYQEHLDLKVLEETENEVTFEAGDSEFILRSPSRSPRGGVHTHFAFSIPADEYEAWYDRLSSDFDLFEFDFGDMKSLYFYDRDRHCVELGQRNTAGDGITGIFEIVLEVEDLKRAEEFYTVLGADVTSRGDNRRRVRLDLGCVDFELWEPQLGIADAQGGVHVDVGFEADNPQKTVEAIEDKALNVEEIGGGIRVRDPDGHYLTFFP